MYAVFPFRGLRVNRWCPSCRKSWPAGRVVCPDCLVELVDDPNATVRCRHCGRDWPATMASCPNCLAELRPDPEAAMEAMGRILAMGGHLPRAAGTVPFADGPACTLLRLSARGGLVYIGPDGLVQAAVAGSQGRAVPPLTCQDAGDVLFRLVPYEPAEAAVVAVGADGGALAAVGRSDHEIDGWIDDQWWLEPAGRLPLRRPAAVAMVLAAKVLLGRPWPVRAGEQTPPDGDDYERWLRGG
ncbi:MAG TPA: hypothetical protein VNT52_08830 [Acidimicrobiales bacterium]|nr:hypothetical protein [Acidimicrobiales bacterium]